MFLKIQIILLLSSSYTLADTINVSKDFKKYSLEFSENSIHLVAHSIDLSLTKSPCNTDLIHKFSQQIHYAFKRQIKLKTPDQDSLRVDKSDEHYFLSSASPPGKFFLLIPDEVKRLKIEESFRCK